MEDNNETIINDETFYQKTKKTLIKFNTYLKKKINTRYLYIILLILIILILLNNNIIGLTSINNSKNKKKINKVKVGGEGEVNLKQAQKNQAKQIKEANKQSLKNLQQQQRAQLYGKRDKQGNLLRDNKGNVRMESGAKTIKKNLYYATYTLFALIVFLFIPLYPLIFYIVFLHRVIIMMIQFIKTK